MKTTLPLLAVTLTLTLTLAATASAAHGADTASAAAPGTTAATTDDAHRRLGELAGLWNVRQSLWLVADRPPQVDAGTAVFTPVLGGRVVQQDLRVSADVPFQGLGFTGYDPATRTCFTAWLDVNLSDVLLLYGTYDETSRTYRFKGAMRGSDGQPVPTREELHIVDTHHFIARYFETRGGTEALMVELAYSRP